MTRRTLSRWGITMRYAGEENDQYADGYKDWWDQRWRSDKGGDGTSTYGKLAETYRSKVQQVVSQVKGLTVLDVGCGSLNQWGGSLPVKEENFYGLDVATPAITRSQGRHPKATFICADATQDDIWREVPSVDVVTCTDMLNHLHPGDYDTVLENMLFVAEKAVIIRMWHKKEWDGAGGYHWYHDVPAYSGWSVESTLTDDPVSPWTLHICRRLPDADRQ